MPIARRYAAWCRRSRAGHTQSWPRVSRVCFVIVYAGAERGRMPIKGFVQRLLTFDEGVDLLAMQARRKWGTTLPAAG